MSPPPPRLNHPNQRVPDLLGGAAATSLVALASTAGAVDLAVSTNVRCDLGGYV